MILLFDRTALYIYIYIYIQIYTFSRHAIEPDFQSDRVHPRWLGILLAGRMHPDAFQGY